MIDLKEIEEEIECLEESKCTTYDVCNKLAILYIVKEHFEKRHAGIGSSTMKSTSSPMMGMSNSNDSMAKNMTMSMA